MMQWADMLLPLTKSQIHKVENNTEFNRKATLSKSAS